jgi:ADP-ribose pyrophosphatase
MAKAVKVGHAKTTKFGPFAMVEAKLKVERADGHKAELTTYVFERSDSVAVLVHRRDKDSIVLARQFRFPALLNKDENSDGWLIETPAGIQEKGEDAKTAARREVEEEIGFRVKRLDCIATFFVSPGGASERIALFYAGVEGPPKSAGGGLASEHEDIEIVEMPTAAFLDAVTGNKIRDGKTLLAGYWLAANLAKLKTTKAPKRG